MGSTWLCVGGGLLYFDKMAVMGCRTVPYACQRMTNLIRHIMKNVNYIVFNYIDDFISLGDYITAQRSYVVMGDLLRDLGVNEASEKSVELTQIVELLGILYDFINMIISIPTDKLQDINDLLLKWQKKIG